MSTISERATAGIKTMPAHEMPISEQFRIVALQYVDADGAASLFEEMKTTSLEQLKSALILDQGDMADNKAERIVKSGPAWEEYIRKMVNARTKANKLKLQLEYFRIKEREQDRSSWLQRTEHKMGRSST
tara:strand:+ start:3730 stop:4119 length:390 start_codon:yes stop_codon:yes gene_type:complete